MPLLQLTWAWEGSWSTPLSYSVRGEARACCSEVSSVAEEQEKLLAHLSVAAWGMVPAVYRGYGDEDAALCISRSVSWGVNRVCPNRNNQARVLQEEKESQCQMHHKQDDRDTWRWPWWEQGPCLLLTLRETTSLSCPRWPHSFVELQMLFCHCQRSQCFIVCLWYKHWNNILICKRNYGVDVLFHCSGAPSLGIWWHWLSSWSQIWQTLALALGPEPGMLNWKMNKVRNLCP